MLCTSLLFEWAGNAGFRIHHIIPAHQSQNGAEFSFSLGLRRILKPSLKIPPQIPFQRRFWRRDNIGKEYLYAETAQEIYENRMALILRSPGIYHSSGLDGSDSAGLYVGDHNAGADRGKRHGRDPGCRGKDAGLRPAELRRLGMYGDLRRQDRF